MGNIQLKGQECPAQLGRENAKTSKAFRLQLQETSEGKVFPSERVLEKLEELERGYSNEATARAKFGELL